MLFALTVSDITRSILFMPMACQGVILRYVLYRNRIERGEKQERKRREWGGDKRKRRERKMERERRGKTKERGEKVKRNRRQKREREK
jgi:hypothetical protein